MPHPPQLAGSVMVFVHMDRHRFGFAAGQPHTPAVQVCPVRHAMPHMPQLAASVIVFVQVPLQSSGVAPVQFPPLELELVLVLVELELLVVEPPVPLELELLVAPPVPLELELLVAPPVPLELELLVVAPPMPLELELLAVEPPAPLELEPLVVVELVLVLVELDVLSPVVPDFPLLPHPIAAPCSATNDTPSVSHDRRLIRVLLWAERGPDVRGERRAKPALAYRGDPPASLRVQMQPRRSSQIDRPLGHARFAPGQPHARLGSAHSPAASTLSSWRNPNHRASVALAFSMAR
jgi:hypothetical protein